MRQRRAQRWLRCIDSSVYDLSTLNGVHSSRTTIKSAPSCRCMSMDRSGVRRWMLPSTYDRKVAASSSILINVYNTSRDLHTYIEERQYLRDIGEVSLAFDLVGDGAEAHREDLVASAVGEHRPAPSCARLYSPSRAKRACEVPVKFCRPPIFSMTSGPGASMR